MSTDSGASPHGPYGGAGYGNLSSLWPEKKKKCSCSANRMSQESPSPRLRGDSPQARRRSKASWAWSRLAVSRNRSRASIYSPGGNRETSTRLCSPRCLPINSPGGNRPEGHRQTGFCAKYRPDSTKLRAQHLSAAAKGAWPVSDESTAVLQGQLVRAVAGYAASWTIRSCRKPLLIEAAGRVAGKELMKP
jgi:hypothetical protein